MAAVTSSPPSTAASPPPPSPSRRKPLPLHNLTQQFDWSNDIKPLPTVPPASGSPRLRQPPLSPVRVSVKPDNWAQPSNADIETARTSHQPHKELSPPRKGLDRDLPRTPDAPTPPPHPPVLQNTSRTASMPETSRVMTKAAAAGEKPLPKLKTNVEAPSKDDTRSFSSPGSATNQASGVGRYQASMSRGNNSPDLEILSPRDALRNSRETESTVSTTQQQASTNPSVATSASSLSGINETPDTQDASEDASPESSVIEDGIAGPASVPQLQYHHQAFLPQTPTMPPEGDPRIASTPDLMNNSEPINRHLTPNSYVRRSSLPRPHSAYSVYSDTGPRGRSPNTYGGSHMRAPSAHSRRSPETRPSSYADMLNVPYPQPAPAPITLDNTQLRNAVGTNASLLSTQKTLEMYRQNVKKTQDFSIQYSFAVFLISTAQEQGLGWDERQDTLRRKGSPKAGRDGNNSPYLEKQATSSPHELVREAKTILQKLASAGYPFAQYYLADGYASGLFSKGKEDYNAAFPLFVLAAKHGHAESAYRTGLCYEFGWGCRKDPAKAVQFLRTAASKRHPGAMTRLGKACLSGDLGEKRYREGIKWLKLASEAADSIYNAAPYHLGCLYEMGYGDDIFQDESYAAELFTQAADLGHAEANFRMGDAYEHGRLNCPRDPALSVHFYTGAAERGHAAAMMGLCAWYMVGAEPILEKDEEEAYEWARRSAELGHVKAQYAIGYFTEMGIGCRRDILEANVWYVKAADAGDERAKQRLAAIKVAISGGTPMEVAPPRNNPNNSSGKIRKTEKDDNCAIM